MRIRPYHSTHDMPALRICFLALQDHEHEFNPKAPLGVEIVDEYVAFMLHRCSECAGQIFLAEVDERVAGFVCVLARIPRAEPDDSDVYYAEVSELSILPEYRNQGIGSALLQHAETYAYEQAASSFRVRVDARNQGALRLYKRLGFAETVITLAKTL